MPVPEEDTVQLSSTSRRPFDSQENEGWWRPAESVLRRYCMATPMAHALFRVAECAALRGVSLVDPVLEIGCGRGQFAELALQRRLAMGLDIVEANALAASRTGVYEQVLCADASHLPLPDCFFSTVLSVSMLEHVREPEAAIQEGFRVLRPGGRFIATITLQELYDELHWSRWLRWFGLSDLYVRIHHQVFSHYSMFSADQWRAWLIDSGFLISEAKRIISPKTVRRWDAVLPVAVIEWMLAGVRLPHALFGQWTKPITRRWVAAEDFCNDGAVLLVVAEKPRQGQYNKKQPRRFA